MGVFEGAFPQWAYLIGYNIICAVLWLSISTWTALTAAADGLDQVYPTMRILVLFTQTLAALEIVHAVIGMFSSHYQPFLSSPHLPWPSQTS